METKSKKACSEAKADGPEPVTCDLSCAGAPCAADGPEIVTCDLSCTKTAQPSPEV